MSSGQAALPPTSLIICSRNRPGMLSETVRSVLAGREVPTELIVVDQSDVPADHLASMWQSEACEVRYTWSPVLGLSHANNLGVRLARHDVLVFTHDDVHPDERWFGTLVRSLLAAGPRSVVTGRVPPGPPEVPGGFQQTLRTSQTPRVWEGRTRDRPLLVLNMAMLRATYDEVGGFDERLGPGTPFPGAEDVDLGFRLLEAGYRIIYVPEAVLYHRAWRKPSTYLSIRWAYGLALGGYYAKHLSVRDRWMASTMVAVLRSRTSRGVRALPGQPRAAVGDFLSVAGIFAGTGLWWLTQARKSRPARED
jgi:GT2 family glycosyltransferase